MKIISAVFVNLSIISQKFFIGLMAAVLLIFPLSPAVLAATDEEATIAAQDATGYLAENQNVNGSIAGWGGETEWSVIALEAAGIDANTVESTTGNSTLAFLEDDVATESTSTGVIERKILAINAAGEDSKDFGGVDYNQLLKDDHNTHQLGDVNLLTDDFFGVLAIEATGDETMKYIAQDSLDYFLSYQNENGSFAYTTIDCGIYCIPNSNDTAAAIQAMYAAERLGLDNVKLFSSKDKAILYLLSTQNIDGGFGFDDVSPSDNSSTAWALMALNLVGSCAQNQASSARNYLLSTQNIDGGFGFDDASPSDTYTTAHAVTAILGSSWTLDAALHADHDQKLTICAKSVLPSLAETPRSMDSDPTITSVLSPAVFASDGPSNSSSDQKAESREKQSKNKSAVLQSEDSGWKIAVPTVLILVALAWYLLQSRGKKTGVA